MEFNKRIKENLPNLGLRRLIIFIIGFKLKGIMILHDKMMVRLLRFLIIIESDFCNSIFTEKTN